MVTVAADNFSLPIVFLPIIITVLNASGSFPIEGVVDMTIFLETQD